MSQCWGHLFTYYNTVTSGCLYIQPGDNKKHFNTIEQQIAMQRYARYVQKNKELQHNLFFWPYFALKLLYFFVLFFMCHEKSFWCTKLFWYLCWLYALIFFLVLQNRLLCVGVNNQSYFCDSGHCCGESQCCSYYYEVWCKYPWVSLRVSAAYTCCKIRSVHGVNDVCYSVWNILQFLCTCI